MHPSESADPRQSVVVERDWLTDEWVVTSALSDAQGRVISTVANRYPVGLWSATDLADLVFGVVGHPLPQ